LLKHVIAKRIVVGYGGSLEDGGFVSFKQTDDRCIRKVYIYIYINSKTHIANYDCEEYIKTWCLRLKKLLCFLSSFGHSIRQLHSHLRQLSLTSLLTSRHHLLAT